MRRFFLVRPPIIPVFINFCLFCLFCFLTSGVLGFFFLSDCLRASDRFEKRSGIDSVVGDGGGGAFIAFNRVRALRTGFGFSCCLTGSDGK